MKNKFQPTKLSLTRLAAMSLCGLFASSAINAQAGETKLDSTKKSIAESSSLSSDAKNPKDAKVSQLYDFKKKALDGAEIDFSKYKGDVLLIVNTASKCGYTPQYAGLEDLNKKYRDKGLKVLGFPCNQFKAQEPGDNLEISSFCQKNYGVDFQMFDKIDVNGDKADPLYVYLKKVSPNGTGDDIRWNFTKFLVDRKGNVYKRYDSAIKPEALTDDIEKLL